MKWRAVLDKPTDLTHVVPLQGREHVLDKSCWCEPRRDQEEPRIVIHNYREQA